MFRNRWRNRFRRGCIALLLIQSVFIFQSAIFPVAMGQAGTAVVRPNPAYWEVLARSQILSGGKQIPATGTLKFQARRRLRITLMITGYGGGGDTAAWQFNGDTATANYKYRCSTTADGVTWTAGANATSTDRIKIAPSDVTTSRNVEALVTNDVGTADKTVGMMITVTGTGSAASQSNLDLCNGGWISPANTQITQLVVMTTTNNMGARSSVVVEGSNY